MGEFFTAYAWVTIWEMDTRTKEEIAEGVDCLVPVCTPHCLFDFARKQFHKQLTRDSHKPIDDDLLHAIAFDVLAALDGFGTDASTEQWQALNDAHERLGITLGQYSPPSIEEYLGRDNAV